MRWYDYVACVWFADMITAGLFSGSILYLTAGIFSYTLYADMRMRSE